jgi:DHA2 family multidrug resistance protein
MQLALDRGQHKDWFDSWEIIVEAIISLSAFWIFFVHTRKTPHPLFRRELFSNKPFLVSLSFMLILGVAVVGLSSVLPMMFQSIYHFPVIDSGLMMAPRGIGVMITSYIGGRLVSRMDYRWIITSGYLVAAMGMWLMSTWSLEMDKKLIYEAIFIQGFGMGMIFSPMNLMAFSTLPPLLRPDGSSLLSLFRSLGGSIGISVIVTLLARNQQIAHADIGAHINSGTIPGFDWSGMLDRLGGMGTGVLAMIDSEVNRQAMMIAFLDDFKLLTWMLIAFSPIPFLLKRPAQLPANMDRTPVME